MKRVVVVLAVTALALACLAYAEANPQPSPDKKEVSITLTAEQVKVVKAGAEKNVTITLTAEQTKLIGGGRFDVPPTLALNASHLGRGNAVLLLLKFTAERVSMDPQPSP